MKTAFAWPVRPDCGSCVKRQTLECPFFVNGYGKSWCVDYKANPKV